MLNLGKYKGVSVSALNKILRGKGSLSGQGKAVAYACKKYNLNEIYLIAHALRVVMVHLTLKWSCWCL